MSRDIEHFVEGFGDIHGGLSRHGVDGEKNFRRFKLFFELPQLFHHRLVDLKSARRIDKHHVVSVFLRVGESVFRDFERRGFVVLRIYRNAGLFSDDLELSDRGGAIHVAGDEQGVFALLFHHGGKLARVCGFAGALKSDHHDDCRRFG